MLTAEVTFAGSAKDQKIAQALFEVMRAHGRFMSLDAAIRITVDSAAEYLSRDGGKVDAAKIRDIAIANAAVFTLEQTEEQLFITTTRTGQAARDRVADDRHSFAARLMAPPPKPETPALPARERKRVDPSWATIDQLLSSAEVNAIEEEELAEIVEEVVEPVAVEVEAVEVEAEVEPEPQSRTVRVSPAAVARFTQVDDIQLANAIGDRLRVDPRIANFGEEWMLEERVPRFSRNELRRLREYILEQEQPLTDDVLAQDVLGMRPGTPDFELNRFALNVRLSKEHRDFDFVGTPNQRFWSTSNLPQIGTTRRKPNEIGTDFKYLADDVANVAPRSLESVDHVLTFYEYHLGLLPFDEQLQTLLPAPVLASQRTAVLTFECPQSYTTYLVELRYPTPNRGGFILGLDDFYNENLVPGALLTIEATKNDGHYRVQYVAEGSQSGRLLELEDRRQRYVFRPTTYACGVIEEFLLTEERFPNLASEKPLDEKVRRRPESVVSASFERLGQKSDGPGFVADFSDLLAAVNIERPFSERYLRSILENDETGAFARDPDRADAYTYVPVTTA